MATLERLIFQPPSGRFYPPQILNREFDRELHSVNGSDQRIGLVVNGPGGRKSAHPDPNPFLGTTSLLGHCGRWQISKINSLRLPV